MVLLSRVVAMPNFRSVIPGSVHNRSGFFAFYLSQEKTRHITTGGVRSGIRFGRTYRDLKER